MICITTYPRSGTTLTQNIVVSILGYSNFDSIKKLSPFINPVVGSELVPRKNFLDNPPDGALAIKTHRTMMPNPAHKYIYVARNPLDCFVSNWKLFWNKKTEEEALKTFLNGDMRFGRWFEHVSYGLKTRENENVLFLFYEEIVSEKNASIRKIAKFLNVELTDEEVESLCESTSFQSMQSEGKRFFASPKFFRKGVCDSWKEDLSKESVKKISEITQKFFDQSDFPVWPKELWDSK